MTIRPDRLLKDVAAELYRRTEQHGEDALLQYLRHGQLTACIILPIPDLSPVPVDPAFWMTLPDRDFKVRRFSGGRWHPYYLCIWVEDVIRPGIADIQKLISALLLNDQAALESPVLSRWLPKASHTKPDCVISLARLIERLIARLVELGALTNTGKRVFVTAEEWDRFFENIGPTAKGPGGRKPLVSDAFWTEFVALLNPPKPLAQQKTLIHELHGLAEKTPGQKPSEQWIRDRVQDVYAKMKWNA